MSAYRPIYCGKCGSVMVHGFPLTGKFSTVSGSRLHTHHFECPKWGYWFDGHDHGDEQAAYGKMLYDDADVECG